MEIVEPIALARIPRPLHENSQPRFAPVHGLSAGQKRKRHELCVAVDGDSIGVYDVQNGNILSSYAIPPTSSFLCPPCSLKIKSEKRTYSRYTYCATRRSSSQIECFIERFDHGRSLGVSSIAKPFDDTDSPLIYLDATPSDFDSIRTSSGHTVIAVHKNGRVRRFTEGLGSEESITRLDDPEASSLDVLAAHCSTFEDAQDSILKHRPDVISSVGSNSTFLTLLYYDLSDSAAIPKVGIWSIYSGLRPGFNLSNQYAKPLIIHNLPEAKKWSPQAELDCSFAPRASALSVSSAKGIIIYDLTYFVPSITWELWSEPHKLFSVTRLTTSLVAGATQASLTIYDTKYNSTRASLDLTRVGTKRKRQTLDTPIRGALKIVAYFPQLGRILAMRRTFLLAFDLKGVNSKIGAKASLLIDSIGKGVSDNARSQSCSDQMSLNFGTVDNLEASSADWDALRRQMREMAQNGDVERFESLFGKAVGDLQTEMNIFPGKNGAIHTLPTFKLPYTDVHYILSILFHYVAPKFGDKNLESRSTGSLELVLPAHRVLSWLIRSQHLTQEAVLKALTSTFQSSGDLEYGDDVLARALMNSDSSFGLLSNYISNNISLEANELAAIVKMVLKVAVAETEGPDTKQTLRLEEGDIMDHDLTDGLKDATESAAQLQVPPQNLDHHPLSLSSVMRALSLALEKWAVHGPSSISRQMRSVLGQAEILALIQFLRQRLFQDGHTKSISQEPYPTPPAMTRDSEDNHAVGRRSTLSLDSILKLLLGCVDAIGPLGFFANGVEQDFMASLIPDLKSEISLALEGMEEASYLRGVLRETMRYAESAKKVVNGNHSNPLTGRGNLAVQEPGTIATLYSEPTTEQGDVEGSIGMLPLSLRAENVISRVKMRKGGGQVTARSIREMQELENRSKGKYSLERLVL